MYYYKEGMAAPMGTFKTYSCEPLAVMVVDRSLRERTDAGCYETVLKLPGPNSYDVVFFLDAPRIICRFPVDVQPNPELVRQRNEGKVDVTHIVDDASLTVGKATRVRFKLTDRSSGEAKSGLTDVTIQTLLVPTSYERYPAKEIEPGVYAIELSPAEAGIYYITVASAAIGLTHDNPNMLILRVLPASDSTDSATSDRASEQTTNPPGRRSESILKLQHRNRVKECRKTRTREMFSLRMLLAGLAVVAAAIARRR